LGTPCRCEQPTKWIQHSRNRDLTRKTKTSQLEQGVDVVAWVRAVGEEPGEELTAFDDRLPQSSMW